MPMVMMIIKLVMTVIYKTLRETARRTICELKSCHLLYSCTKKIALETTCITG